MFRKPIVLIGSAMSALGLIGITYSAVWPGAGSAPGRDAQFSLRVSGARPATCTNGQSLWTVGADLLARGEPGEELATATLRAGYATEAHGAWRDAAVEQAGTDTFVPGRTVDDDGSLRMQPTVRVALPCGVTQARLIAVARLTDEGDPRRAEAPFVSDGIAMSVPGVGGFLVAAVVGVFAVMRVTKARAVAA